MAASIGSKIQKLTVTIVFQRIQVLVAMYLKALRKLLNKIKITPNHYKKEFRANLSF
jgi:hypothetical protein